MEMGRRKKWQANRPHESLQIVPEAFPEVGTEKSASTTHSWHASGGSLSLSDLKYTFHIYKEGCFSFGCKDSVNRVQNKTNPFLFYAGALVYFHSHSLIFRFESLVGIVIKENSYFSDFSGRPFFVYNLLFYNLFRCF